ncbi:MAG: peptidoglycan DD-metalloendopeptidase family protein, partial [Anaerolineales bacterium]
SDFGRFRGRYDGYHTGEDWRVGTSSFGQPVYSIGHGRVTYAQPNGWGADKGVVIVEHTFRDGRRIHSLYGHLDPPSVELRAGQCAERGDQVGNIGDPRSPPHLHFEIRIHMPNTPGPGYWSVDPSRSGWKPPSATIWSERMAALPGVRWTHLSAASSFQPLGVVDDELLAHLDAGEIIALDMESGRTAWSRTLPTTPNSVLLDVEGGIIYVNRSGGAIEAYGTSDLKSSNSGSTIEPLWSVEMESAGFYDLIPLPLGGLVATSRSGTTAISHSGEELWHEDAVTGIADWAQTDDSLILLDRSGIWLANEGSATRWTDSISGHRVVASDHPFVYAADGVYGLDAESRSLDLFGSLPSGFPRSGNLIELPGGGVVVAHTDLDDKRLIAIDADGSLRWERSIAGLGSRAIELLVLDDQVYMLIQFDIGRSTGIDLFHVNSQSGDLARIFSGGTRSSVSDPLAFTTEGESIIISIPGVGLAVLEPQSALETVHGE